MNFLKCKYCGELVRIVENSRRKRIFVDDEPVEFVKIQTHGDAYQPFIMPNGERVYGRPPKPSDEIITTGYVEHKFSCVNQHPFERKNGKKARKKRHE